MELSIDKSSQIPIYAQIVDCVKRGIEDGQFQPGSKMLSETEIQNQYGISRVTVRKAYTELMEDGYLVRKQGKGTFVKDIHFQENLSAVSFSDTCRKLGFEPSSKLIRTGFTGATKLDERDLGISAGGQVAFMERIRFADGVPVRLERNYYAEAYRDIIYEDLEKSVHKILQEKYGLSNPRKLDFTIAIGYANEEEAKLLQIEKKSSLLKVHGVLKNSRGQGVYRSEMLHLPDRCVLAV